MMLYHLPEKGKGGRRGGLVSVQQSSLEEAGWSEKDLEDMLAENLPKILREDYLMVIFQERLGKAEPDLLALDETGRLHIFELKRWEAEEENIIQVLRYGQKFGQYDYERLNDLFVKHIKKIGGTDRTSDLQKEHQQYFELSAPLELDKFNYEQRFVVITDGLDLPTVRAINYWRDRGLPVKALVYRVYKVNNEFLFDFNPYSPVEEDIGEGRRTRNWVVNTNATYMERAYRQMLNGNKASAYYSRKHAVDNIQKGDKVFLYHVGSGIIAYGFAKDKFQEKDFSGDKGEEHYVPCAFKIKVDPKKEPSKVVSAREINRVLESNYCFRQTAFTIDDTVADTIINLLKEKTKPQRG